MKKLIKIPKLYITLFVMMVLFTCSAITAQAYTTSISTTLYYEGDELLNEGLQLKEGTFTVYLKNVNTAGLKGHRPPIEIYDGASVTLVIEGENYLSTQVSSPVISFCSQGGSLTIKCASNHDCDSSCPN